jgi:hypothetical protein
MKKSSILVISAVVVCVLTIPHGAQAAITDGLLGYWPMDENSGTAAFDNSGRGNHGVLLNGPAWTTGKVGNALDFHGGGNEMVNLNTDGVLDSGKIPAILMPTTAVSVSAWVKADTFDYYRGIFWDGFWTGTTNQSGFSLWQWTSPTGWDWWVKTIGAGGIYSWIQRGGTAGVWTHLVGTFSSTQNRAQLYINGALAGTSNTNTSQPIDWDPIPWNVAIGCYNDDNEAIGFDGIIDEVAVWNRELTGAEITSLYNGGAGVALDVPGPMFPTPINGAWPVMPNADLSWTVPTRITPTGYDLYFGTDPCTPVNPKVLTNANQTTYDPGTMAYDKQYYWRVDPVKTGGIRVTGADWTFRTVPIDPNFIQQPADVVVKAGQSAVFNVEVTVPPGYTTTFAWYKAPLTLITHDGVKYIIASTNTTSSLTIADVQPADEGGYFCKATNNSPGNPSRNSRTAQLRVAKLLGHWPFDGNYNDTSGNGVTGTPVGDPDFVAGLIGTNAVYLDGNDYVRIDAIAGYIPTNDVTLSGWVKTTDTGADWFSCNTSIGGNVALFGITGGKAAMYDTNPSAWEGLSTTTVSNGQWRLLTYTRSGATGSIYVDGLLENTHTANYNFSSNNRWSIGQEWDTDTPSDFLIGVVDDARLYNYPLTAAEVKQLYLDGMGVICTAPIDVDITGPYGEPDCKVNLWDLGYFVSRWLDCNWEPILYCQ